MIVGNGDIAKALKEFRLDKKGVVFFASGVSNRKNINGDERAREMQLLKEYSYDNVHLVYFSSLSIYYSQNEYSIHKMIMEKRVKYLFKRHTIIRIGNILWGDNPNTLINYFKNKILNKEMVDLQKTYRYLLSKEEFIHWLRMIPVGLKNEMNIPGKMVYVPDLFKDIQDGKY